MRSRTTNLLVSGLVCALAPTIHGCMKVDPDVSSTAKSCEEFAAGQQVDGTIDVDASVRLFMQAASDFSKMSSELRGSVATACGNMAKDLGADDSWTALGDSDDAITNGDGTGACDVAAARIQAVMQAHADANFALVVTRGACHPDFEAQTACDAQCKAQATCDSGTVETRCEPADLSVQCDASCNADAYCEGTTDVAANCMGQCEATCEGECKGTCVAPDGTKTDGNPNCHGKCSSSCNGTCRGLCKVEAPDGISCGASVSCRGGCSGTYTAPKCTSLFTPPKCTVDQACLDACSAEVAKNAVCEPTKVELFASVSVSADVKILVDTVNANMSILIGAQEGQAKLVLAAAQRLTATGQAVLEGAGHLDAKSIACAGAAVEASVETAAHLEVTVDASSHVADGCRQNAD